MQGECVSLPKTRVQLAQMEDDDDNVFATSLINRYAARPNELQNMCLATFAVTYDVATSSPSLVQNEDINIDMDNLNNDNFENPKIMMLKGGLGQMRKRKQESILRTKEYKVHTEPEKYFHAKLLLYYPWTQENELISGFKTYEDSYKDKQHIIQEVANKFNDDCDIFDLSVHDIENDTVQSAWDLVAPSIAQEDAITSSKGCSTLQLSTYEKENDAHGIITGDSSCLKDVLSKLYEKAAKKQFMNFQDYCKKVRSLNNEQ